MQQAPETHVLVVDDDRDIREIIRITLEDEGYVIAEAADGLVGLDYIRTSPQPLIVILDYQMPRLDGPGLINFLSQEPGLAERHAFIHFTAIDRVLPPVFAGQLRSLQAPVLRKPFDLEQMLTAVAEAAERIRLRQLAADDDAPDEQSMC